MQLSLEAKIVCLTEADRQAIINKYCVPPLVIGSSESYTPEELKKACGWVTISTKNKDGGYFVPPDFADELIAQGLVSQEPDGTFILND